MTNLKKVMRSLKKYKKYSKFGMSSNYTYAVVSDLNEKILKSFKDPYDALMSDSGINFVKDLCLIQNNKIIQVLNTREIVIKWALTCAKSVLRLFDANYPNDKKPKKAIEYSILLLNNKDPNKIQKIYQKLADAIDDINIESYQMSGPRFGPKHAAHFAALSIRDSSNAILADGSNAIYKYALNAVNAAQNAFMIYNDYRYDDGYKNWQRDKLNKIVSVSITTDLIKQSQYSSGIIKKSKDSSKLELGHLPEELLRKISKY